MLPSSLKTFTLTDCPSLSQIPMLPSSLETHISNYESLKSLQANNNQLRFPYQELVFEDMSDWEEWPGLKSGDFPCLRRLTIRRCNKLRRFPFLPSSLLDKKYHGQQVGFPCLEELLFEGMSEWKEWSGVMDEGDFPCLRKLTLTDCPSLSQILMLPSSLKTLHISHCNSLKSLPVNNEQVRFPYMEELVFDHMPAWEGWPGLDSGDFPCLCRLTIRNCNKLRRFPLLPSPLLHKKHGQQFGFPYLVELLFDCMSDWEEWSGVMDGDFPCLRKLTLRYCPLLIGLPVLPASLQSLHVSNCYSLKSLPVNHGQVRFPCMKELDFQDMPDWEEWPGLNSGDFPCLCKLSITGCDKLRRFPLLPSSLDKNHEQIGFPCLEEMVLEDIPELQQEWYGVSDRYFPCLSKLTIKHCQKLQRFPTLPSSLKFLSIKSCWSLTSLAGLQNLTSLESLKLRRCPNLHISSYEGLPSKPQHVKIVDCLDLQEWCNMHQFNCIQKSYRLAELTIYDSQTIIRDLGVGNLTSLTRLELSVEDTHLPSDGWLPPTIQNLQVCSCDWLVSLPLHQNLLLLTRLEIRNCPVLASVDGLHNLPNLEELSLTSCPELQLLPDNSLPSSLQSLSVIDCEELRSLPLLHEKLSSLEKLEVFNCPELTIMAGLHNLSSLKTLIIRQCPRLRLSSDEQPSSMPHFLSIVDCPALEEWCQQQSIPYSQENMNEDEIHDGR